MFALRAALEGACYADRFSCSSGCRHARAGILSRGALISLLLHLNLVAPLVIAAWVYGGREEAQRAEEVDVAFQEPTTSELPPDLPPIEPTPRAAMRAGGRRRRRRPRRRSRSW